MNILFYLEPLIIQNNPYLYGAWIPLWIRLVKSLNKTGEMHFKMITGNALSSIIHDLEYPNNLEVIPVPFEEVVEKFNFSSMEASLAWYHSTYTQEQLDYTTQLFKNKLAGWVPDLIISSSHVPFLKNIYPQVLVTYFEGGMTSRPPFSSSWYLDPIGLYRYSFLAKFSKEINDLHITKEEQELLERYRKFFVSLINSKHILMDFAQKFRKKFRYIILLPLQPQGFWFQGNCDFPIEIEFVHKILSSIDTDIGVVVTPHPSNPWFTKDIVKYFEDKFPNFLYSPEILNISSASQYLLEHVDAVLSVSSMVGLQALIWKKRLFSIGETHLKVGADYCFKSDLSDIGELSNLLEKPKIDRDNVLFWLLTRFYVPEFYFFTSEWLINFIQILMKSYISGNISTETFQQFDDPQRIFSHIFETAILDIPRYRGKELETSTFTFEEKINEIKKVYSGLQSDSKDDLWLSLIQRNYDEEIFFTSGENNTFLLINGWSQLEAWGVWSQGRIADILISLPDNLDKNISLRCAIRAFVNENLPMQSVDVLINNEKVGYWRFDYGYPEPDTQIIIHSDVFNKAISYTHIRFIISSPSSPASLGMSSDTRQLGIALRSIQFNLID